MTSKWYMSHVVLQAGLFSTILTAFLAGSTSWLQEDYTETTADILLHISLQLSNETLREIPAHRQVFEAAATDISINILWFLSLVLSLAAALFGMIVKRWLREYSMWQDEPAQDAIPLRQMRYKAFMKWQVPLIVALLPGLLEIALVLFMVGIIVMLWTLHSLIALIITSFSAILLIAAFSAVIIPALFPCCPYRSPAGWACVVSWDWLCQVYYRALWSLGHIPRRAYREHLARHFKASDWKQRDLRLGGAKQAWADGPGLDVETTKLIHLADAIAWAYERCQSDIIIEQLHYSPTDPLVGKSVRSSVLVPIYAICQKFSMDYNELCVSLHTQYVHRPEAQGHGTFILASMNSLDILDPWRLPGGIVILEILGRLLLAEEEKLFKSILVESNCSSSSADHQLFIDALCLLYHAVRMLGSGTFRQIYANFLVDIYHECSKCEEDLCDGQSPRFRTVAVEILRRMGTVRLTPGNISGDVDLLAHNHWDADHENS